MTAYNNHVLSQGALAVARESAAREQREKDAALLRREARKTDAEAARLARQRAGLDAKVLRAQAAALRAVAVLIEAGEQ